MLEETRMFIKWLEDNKACEGSIEWINNLDNLDTLSVKDIYDANDHLCYVGWLTDLLGLEKQCKVIKHPAWEQYKAIERLAREQKQYEAIECSAWEQMVNAIKTEAWVIIEPALIKAIAREGRIFDE